jgi:hypothetical protein
MASLAERLAAFEGKKVPSSMDERLAAFESQVPADVPVWDTPPEYEGERLTPAPLNPLDVAKSVGGGFNKGMTDLVDMPFMLGNLALSGTRDAANLAFDAGLDKDKYNAKMPSQVVDDLTGGFVSEATGRAAPKGQNPLIDAAYTFGEFGGTAGLPMAKAAGVGKEAVPILRSGAPDLIAGGGAAMGGALTGGDVYGELGGGIVAPILGGKVNEVIEGAKGAWEGLVKGQSVSDSARQNLIMQDNGGESLIIDARRALAEGEKGTLAQITGDAGTFNSEASVNLNTPEGIQLQLARELRNEQTLGNLDNVTGLPKNSLESTLAPVVERDLNTLDAYRTNELMDAERANVQQMEASVLREQEAASEVATDLQSVKETQATVKADEQALKAAEGAFDPKVEPSDASIDFDKTWTAAESRVFDKNVQPLYDEFDATPIAKDTSDEIAGVLNNSKGNLDKDLTRLQYERAVKEPAIANVLADIGEWKTNENVTGADIQDVIKDLKRVNKAAKGTIAIPANHEVKVLSKNMIKEAESMLIAASPKYKEANEAFTVHKKTIGQDRFKKLAEKDVAPEMKARDFLKTNEGGAVSVREMEATGEKEILDKYETYLRALATKDGVDAQFMKNYDALLRQHPETKELMETALAKQEKLAESTRLHGEQSGRLTKTIEKQTATVDAEGTKRATTLPKALETSKKSIKTKAEGEVNSLKTGRIYKFVNKPEAYMKSLLNNPDRAKQLDQFVDDVQDVDGAGEGISQALLKSVADYKTKSVDGRVEFNDDFIKSVDEISAELRHQGVLTEKQAIDLADVTARVQVDQMMNNAKAPKGVQMEQFKRVLSAAASMAVLRGTGSNSLIMANAMRRAFLSITPYAGRQTDAIRVEMDRMLADPKAFLKGAKFPTKDVTPAEADTFVSKLFEQRVNATRATQTTKDYEEE